MLSAAGLVVRSARAVAHEPESAGQLGELLKCSASCGVRVLQAMCSRQTALDEQRFEPRSVAAAELEQASSGGLQNPRSRATGRSVAGEVCAYFSGATRRGKSPLVKST